MKLAELSKGVEVGGQFRLIEILGRGSYGDVWLADVIARQEELPAKVAVKIYHHQDRANEVLFREGKQAIHYSHERLVRVFGVKRFDGLVVMWMEYVPGQTLLQYLGEDEAPKPLSLETVIKWLKDIAEGLAYLHVQDPQCIHGDLKLDNVLIDPQGGARLTDFGQSRTLENQYVSTVGVGGILYLAPEIFGRNDAKGTRFVQSDVYAFGVVAYRMLCGRFPHRNYQEIINRIPFPRPRHINASIPEELDRIVWKCLEKRPADRYRTGSELLADFESMEHKLAATKAAPVSLPEKLGRRTPAEELATIAGEKLDKGLETEVVDTLEVAIRHMSTSAKLLLIYAEAAKRLKKYDLAHEVYARVIRWIEVNGWSDNDQREAYEGLADVSIRLKRYEAAVKAFVWLHERWPDKPWYRYRLGVAYGLAGRYEKSIELLLPLNENEPAALVCGKIGFAYYQNRQIDLACQFFNEALMMDALEPTALFHLAQIRAYQGQLQRADELLVRLRTVEDGEEMVAHLESLLGKNSLSGVIQ